MPSLLASNTASTKRLDLKRDPSFPRVNSPLVYWSSAALGGVVIMPAPPSPYKARKKKKRDSPPTTSSNELATSDKKASAQSPAFPLVAFFWPARRNTSQWVILPLVLMVVGLFRWCAGLWGYSGIDLRGQLLGSC